MDPFFDFIGPPADVGRAGGAPSPEQMAMQKEMGVRAHFLQDIGMGIGPYIMGFVADLLMLGVVLAQMWHYVCWTRHERTFIKIIVGWVLMCALASSCFLLAWFDHLFVKGYGTYSQFVDNQWFQWFTFMGLFLLLGCQIFNLERAYRLHHGNIWVLVAIVPFVLASTAMQIAVKVKTGSGSNWSKGAVAIKPYMTTYLTMIFVTDVAITSIIAWGLWLSRTGWHHTDILIRRVITFSWEAQLPPALTALAMLIGYVHQPDAFTNFFFMICYAKVSAIALMAVLNFRFALRKDGSNRHYSTTGLSKRPQDPRNDSAVTVDNDAIPMVTRSQDDQEAAHGRQ